MTTERLGARRLARGVVWAFTRPWNLIPRAIGRPQRPRWVVFEATDACNSRCKHCNIWRESPTRDVLTPEEIRKIFADNFFKNTEDVLITGGEPVLRPDLSNVMLAIHGAQPKAKLFLSTNALLPQRVLDVVNVVLEHDIHLGVGVSLDGIGEKHDLIRGAKGNFERADYLVHELVKLRKKYGAKMLSVAIGYTLSDLTVDSFDDVRAYAERYHLDFVPQMFETGPYYRNIGENLKTSGRLINVTKSLLPRSPLYEMWLKALIGKPTKFSCFAMYTFFVLRCDGSVVPCLRLANVHAGNLRKSSPSEAWHGPAAEKARELVKACGGCLNTWCVGWSFSSYFLPILSFYLRKMLRRGP